jgi:hypothetical protein
VEVPETWVFVPSGDPGLTRRLKAVTDYWVVVQKRKNRIEARGVWADKNIVEQVKSDIEAERANPVYQRKLAAARQARIAKQDAYVVEFRQAVVDYLHFAPCDEDVAWDLADAVTDQAIPVGSGTVARTERLPLAKRAEEAVIAWMRHQTTGYDRMYIARQRGERRAVRRTLAESSRIILERYRNGDPVEEDCPLAAALK